MSILADEAKTSLIIYEAILELPGMYLVSNGAQTRTLYETLGTGGIFDAALAQWQHEPDSRNYTPVLTGPVRGQRRRTPSKHM